MKAVRLLIPVFSLMTALAPAAHAQFGSGIVYDPTQSAHAVQEIQQGEQQLQKWATELNNWQQHLLKEAQIFTTAEQTRTQIVTMYNLAYQMATMPQNLEARYKADWSQWQSLAAPPNAYGNTSPLVNALNFGGLPQAQQGYNSAYIQPQSYPSGSYSSLDSRTQATVANQYATAELAQSTTTSTLSTLGTIRTDAQAFATSSPISNRTPSRPIRASRPRTPCSARSTRPPYSRSTPSRTPTSYSWPSIQQQLLAQKQQIDAQNRAINDSIYFQQNFSNTMQNVSNGVSTSLHAISLSTTGQ